MTPQKYPLAERFKAPQGEGQYTGTQMAFMRLLGCSVGKKVCTACDTEFDRMRADLGGGAYTVAELLAWAAPCRHVCLTGGEPLDRDIRELLVDARLDGTLCHVETSGTKHPAWLDVHQQPRERGRHAVARDRGDGTHAWHWMPLWVTVSPKPGYLPRMVEQVADEIKVILGGLGDGPGWPTLEDAVRWADAGRLVYLQPRNGVHEIDAGHMREALAAVAEHPQLRLSVQLHKYLATR
jgi:organic radical activating enzyme